MRIVQPFVCPKLPANKTNTALAPQPNSAGVWIATMALYRVGGAVRDLLLGRKPADYDFAFDGSTAQFIASHAGARVVGKTVRVCLWQGQEYMPLIGGSLAADLASRDLTINALALEDNGVLHAHPQALHDLAQRILRPASATALQDDPARVFRLARFAACLPEFTLDATAIFQMRALAHSAALCALPAERIGREVLKALHAPAPSRFLTTLAAGGLLQPPAQDHASTGWFYELYHCDTIPAGPVPWHKGSVLAHTGRVMDACAGDSLAVWMALCHDIGKMHTPADHLPHHYQHEKIGQAYALSLGQRLGLPKKYIHAGELAARLHMKAGMYECLRIGTRRDLLWQVHCAGMSQPFWRMVDADSKKQHSVRALADEQRICAITLPAAWQNQGAASGRHLRELQCLALSRR